MIRARSTRLVGSVRDREISSKRSRCSASVGSAIARRGATTGSPNPIPHPPLTTSRPVREVVPNILIFWNLYTSMLPAVAGKQPGLTGRHPAFLARDAPPFMQYLRKDGRENDVPILLALALLDPDEHPVTIDIGELERYDLRGSQSGGI